MTELRCELVEKWRKFADTDYTKGQKLSDAKKQGQYELMMAGQSIAYATAAKELELWLRDTVGPLVASMEQIRSLPCGCTSPRDPEWHSAHCWKGIAHAALQRFREGSKN